MFNAGPDSADVALLPHDGFTARQALNIAALEAAVLQETGYVVELEEREIVAPEYTRAQALVMY